MARYNIGMRQEQFFIRPIKLPWYAWVLIPLLLVILLAAALFFLALVLVVFLPASLIARWIAGKRGNRYLVPGGSGNNPDSSGGWAFQQGFPPFMHVFWNFQGMNQASSPAPSGGKEIPGELLIPSDTPQSADCPLLLPDGQPMAPAHPTHSQT